jgi:hypothetical protein
LLRNAPERRGISPSPPTPKEIELAAKPNLGVPAAARLWDEWSRLAS